MIDVKKTLISQYANSPKIVGMIDNFNYAVDPADDIENTLDAVLDVNTAYGFGLDILGRIVGVSRLVKLPQAQAYFGFSIVAPALGGSMGAAFGANGWGDGPTGWGGDEYGSVGGGSYFATVKKTDGSIVSVGSDYYGEGTPPAISDAVEISASGSSAAALRSDRTAVFWGDNTYGQLSIGAGNNSDLSQISIGDLYGLALKIDGTVLYFGSDSNAESLVAANQGAGITRVYAGRSSGAWSASQGGIIKNGAAIPFAAPAFMVLYPPPMSINTDAIDICGGSQHFLVLKSDGSVVAWGLNDDGQCNVPSGALSGVIAIAAGSAHSMALKSDGSVLVWGGSSYGNIGVDVTTIPSGVLSGVVAISAGDLSCYAVKAAEVICWGDNSEGQAPSSISRI